MKIIAFLSLVALTVRAGEPPTPPGGPQVPSVVESRLQHLEDRVNRLRETGSPAFTLAQYAELQRRVANLERIVAEMAGPSLAKDIEKPINLKSRVYKECPHCHNPKVRAKITKSGEQITAMDISTAYLLAYHCKKCGEDFHESRMVVVKNTPKGTQ